MTDDREAVLGQARLASKTVERLDHFAKLVRKWSPRINLVAPRSLSHLWGRHIADSMQVLDMVPEPKGHWVDLGSGGGFPGVIVAILAKEAHPDLAVTLVESDHRKAAFLRTVVRDLALPARVEANRIESLAPLAADVVSARALAPLPRLLGLLAPHLLPSGVAVLPKGARHAEEVEEALEDWTFSYQKRESVTQPESVVLAIRDVRRVRNQ